VGSCYVFGEFEVRPDERRLLHRGSPVPLGARAFDVLMLLVEHRDRVVAKAEILDRVWPDTVVEEANLTVHVSALRKVLGPQALATVPGRGYRLVMPVDPRARIGSLEPAPTIDTAASAVGATFPVDAVRRATPDRPSIAVLPFANMSGDPEQGYFADGLVEDIITTLSKISDLVVIARNSTFA
jgi:adenylate cyclase